MPRPNEKRGRRAEEKKRKFEQHREELDDTCTPKKVKLINGGAEQEYIETNGYGDTNGYMEDVDGYQDASYERPFYGLLDEQEQEYFRRADDLLETDQFGTPEERTLFLSNVFKEAEGKELKMACSQSCSRLFEKLILSASSDQLKNLFKAFSGHFLNLVQHRFASHCCETLFIQAAPFVSSENASAPATNGHTASEDEPFVSMENLFLYTINELQGNLGFLLTDKFGSHVLRVLLVIFSGQTVDQSAAQSVLKSKRKEHVEVSRAEAEPQKNASGKRAVPQSFTAALENMMQESIAGLDTSYLRTLATHPIGNPMLQLLLHLDLSHFGKRHAKDEASILHKLLPDEALTEGTESASFINGLIYDTIGSRLLESIIKDAPGKLFKTLYKDYFRDRIASLAKNEVAGYVVGKLLERLSKEDLQKAHDAMIPEIPNLAERGRTAILKTLIERCLARGIDNAALGAALQKAYTEDEGATFSLLKLTNIATPVEPNIQTPRTQKASSAEPSSGPSTKSAPEESIPPAEDLPPMNKPETTTPTLTTNASTLHASLLAQTMLRQSGSMSTMVFEAISKLSPTLVLAFARTPVLSPILQISLTLKHAPVMFRRKLIKAFYSHIYNLAIDPAGSHLVDAIWGGTSGMAFVRERAAEELAENEAALRENPYGRKVWKNWWMDLYKRRRGDWVKKVREVGNDGFLSFPGGVADLEHGKPKKGLTPSEDTAVRRNGGRSSVRRHQSFGSGNESGIPVILSTRGPSSSSGRLETGDSKKPKTRLDLARDKFVNAQRAGHVNGQL